MDLMTIAKALLSLASIGLGIAFVLFNGIGLASVYFSISNVDENGNRGTYQLGPTVLYTLGVGTGVSMVIGGIWILIEIYLK